MSDELALVILKCSNCGNVFPQHQEDKGVCPLCHGADVHPASEPLL
jgi:Zn finger protein HypA/HybF involved in hydrogenase expression